MGEKVDSYVYWVNEGHYLPSKKCNPKKALTKLEKAYDNGIRATKWVDKAGDFFDKSWMLYETTETVNLRSAQFRAIDLLYGQRDKTPNESMMTNPLVDILTLLGVEESNKELQFTFRAVQGEPAQKERLIKSPDPANKYYEYGSDKNILGEQSAYRTIARFGKFQKTMVRGLFVIAKVTEGHQDLLKDAINGYQHLGGYSAEDEGKTALGLLEVLNNLELIKDPVFSKLASDLRGIVLDDVKDYKNLESNYHYRVVRESQFWLEGQKKYQRQLYLGSHSLKEGGDGGRKEDGWPDMRYWNKYLRDRRGREDTLEQLAPHVVLAQKALQKNGAPEKLVGEIRESMQQRALLAEEQRTGERLTVQKLRRDWRIWGEAKRESHPEDGVVMEAVARRVLGLFKNDPDLSQKTRGRLLAADEFYQIDSHDLNRDALFTWVYRLKDDAFYGQLREEAQKNPENLSVLTRLMTYEVAARNFGKKENELLFDVRYAQKADVSQYLRLIDDLRELVKGSTYDIKKATRDAIRLGDMPIKGLFEKKRIKKIEAKLQKLQKNYPIEALKIVSTDKTKRISRRTFLKIARNAAIVAAIGEGGAAIYNAVKAQEISEAADGKSNEEIRFKGLFDEILARVPDNLTASEVAKVQPFYYGQVAHLSDKFKGTNGETIAYFPQAWVDKDGWEYDSGKIWPGTLKTFKMVDSLDKEKIEVGPHQLMVVPKKVEQVILPPPGWKIVGLYQEGGRVMKPFVGQLGQLCFVDPPKKVALVMEELSGKEVEHIGGRINYVKGYQHADSDAWKITFEVTQTVRDSLGRDPKLQKIYWDFSNELAETDKRFPQNLTEVAITYTQKFAQYIDESRYYALDFKVDRSPTASPYESLIAIANHPDKGFYCQVAAEAYQQFMESLGFVVLKQPGYSLRNYDQQLWGDQAHVNNIVLLPNGELLQVDMTPYSTDKTPKEDIDALKPKNPDFKTIERQNAILEAGKMAVELGLGVTVAVGGIYAALSMGGNLHDKMLRQRVERLLQSEKDLLPQEQELTTSMANYLAEIPYDSNFYDESANVLTALSNFSVAEHGASVSWLLDTHGVMLFKNNPIEAYKALVEQYKDNPEVLFEKFPSLKDADAYEGAPADFEIAFKMALHCPKKVAWKFLKIRL